MSCDVRFFADDTSLFSVVNDVAATAFEMNNDLEKINYGRGNRNAVQHR